MSYGKYLYGNITYGEELKNTDIDLLKIDLMKYLPFFYHTKEIKDIQDSFGKELMTLNYNVEDLEKQFFIDTATWGLAILENELDIENNTSLTIAERREIIKAKLRGRGTTTKKMIKDTAEAFSGGECDVIEHNDKYYFTVKFIGKKGIPRNLQSFKNMLENIKPAHLGYIFEYILITHGMLKNNLKVNHNEVKGITHKKMKEYRIDEINEVVK